MYVCMYVWMYKWRLVCMYELCINNCFTCGKAPWICILSFKLVTDWLCRAFLLNMDEIGRVPGGELFSPFGFPPAELFFLLSTPACHLVWVCMYVFMYWRMFLRMKLITVVWVCVYVYVYVSVYMCVCMYVYYLARACRKEDTSHVWRRSSCHQHFPASWSPRLQMK